MADASPIVNKNRFYLTKSTLYQGSLTLNFLPLSILNCFFIWKSAMLQIILSSLKPLSSNLLIWCFMSLPLPSAFRTGIKRSVASFMLTLSFLSQLYHDAGAQVQVIKLDGSTGADVVDKIQLQRSGFQKVVAPNRDAPVFTVGEQSHGPFPDTEYARLVEEYFATAFANSPSWGTQSGFHQYDAQLEDLSAAALSKFEKSLVSFREKFANPDFNQLERDKRLDLAMIEANISANLLDLQQLHSLERDPDKYPSLIADSVFALAKRNFAPVNERFASAIARIEKAPAVLEAGKANLIPDEVPPIYCQIALEQLPGTVDLFKKTIPDAFRDADPALKDRFNRANEKLIAALGDYQVFIKEKVMPKAKGKFPIGADAYAKKLAYDEMEDEKLDVILASGYKELKRLQVRFKDLAHEIDPKVSVRECFDNIASDHPSPDKLVPATADVLDRISKFVVDKKIATIPSTDRVTVAESPSFMRALTFASMDTPGPYEDKAKEAFYYVTPVEPEWDKKHIEEHMRFFSYPDLINTSVHEAYPGHYVQFLWVKHAPSKVRKLLGCSSNAEGWAHYCEEMMIEEGLPAAISPGDTMAQKKLAMIQVHDALLRACRYIVGIEMHTRSMTYDQGIKFFEEEGFMEKANAERETKRGTKDPTYLVYTLGKLKILAIRDRYKAKMGDKFSLLDFHDKFLKCGFPPLKVVEAEVLDVPYSRNKIVRPSSPGSRTQ